VSISTPDLDTVVGVHLRGDPGFVSSNQDTNEKSDIIDLSIQKYPRLSHYYNHGVEMIEQF